MSQLLHRRRSHAGNYFVDSDDSGGIDIDMNGFRPTSSNESSKRRRGMRIFGFFLRTTTNGRCSAASHPACRSGRKKMMYQRLVCLTAIIWSVALFLSCSDVDRRWRQASTVFPFPYSHQRSAVISVVFPTNPFGGVALPGSLPDKNNNKSAWEPNYGYLDLYSIAEEQVFARLIPDDDEEMYHKEHKKYLKDMAKAIGHASVSKREPGRLEHWDEIDYPSENGCYRMKWTYEVNPTCNLFHEVSIDRTEHSPEQSFDISYLGQGTFRSTWKLHDTPQEDDYVLKISKFDAPRNFDSYVMSQIQVEALFMEETTGSNRTMDIYGHCMTSMLVEVGEPIYKSIYVSYDNIAQEELDKEQVDDVKQWDKNTPEEKLQIVLAMAEGLAQMHGYEKGVIVNHDLSLAQWLWDKDGRIKLNDFNKARLLQWKPKEQEYCKFWSHQSHEYCAPEEMKGGDSDEMTDMAFFGKLVYSILTGLKPYYQLKSQEDAVEAAVAGELPYVDPRYQTRSFIEGRLVTIMERCYQTDANDRASIFDVIEYLRETCHLAGVKLEY